MSDYKNTIKIIGFDLDQTLYPKSPEIDSAIQAYIYEKIAETKRCDLARAEKLFKNLYQDGKGLSGGQTLEALEIPNAREIVQEALERADVAPFLKPNKKTVELLEKLKEKYLYIDLISGSSEKQVLSKLERLEIHPRLFTHIIGGIPKSDGTAYKMWLSAYPDNKAEEFLYIGDRPSSDCVVPGGFGIQSILVNANKNDQTISCLQLSSLEELENYLI